MDWRQQADRTQAERRRREQEEWDRRREQQRRAEEEAQRQRDADHATKLQAHYRKFACTIPNCRNSASSGPGEQIVTNWGDGLRDHISSRKEIAWSVSEHSTSCSCCMKLVCSQHLHNGVCPRCASHLDSCATWCECCKKVVDSPHVHSARHMRGCPISHLS